MGVQGTYSFSKTMAPPGSGYTDPLQRSLDYGKAASSVGQEFRANGAVGSQFLHANGRPNMVGPWNNPKMNLTWSGDSIRVIREIRG